MNKIIAAGLGPGDLNQLPLGIYRLLKRSGIVYLRTKDHPVVKELEEEGVNFHSFDSIYEKHDQFEPVYEEICETLLQLSEESTIVYGVPGHPLVAERTVQLLLERAPEKIEIAGGQSFIDPLFQALKIDPIEGFQLIDATDINKEHIDVEHHLIIGQVYDPFIASDVKLALMELLPDDYEICIVAAAGSKGEEIRRIPLYMLDREVKVNNLASVYVPPVKEEAILYKKFSKLREIIRILRGPNGCPWDKKQTHQSLKKYLLEEAYELIEAINKEDIDGMIEELGDVLLQVMLHSQIGEDHGYFSIDDVIEGISGKMIRRHPHVFGQVEVNSAEEVVTKWEEIKKAEKGGKSAPLFKEPGTHLPNLMRAYEIQKQAAKKGFDWEKVEDAWQKVKEELEEFEDEMKLGERSSRLTEEYGDLLFALVNVARFYQINPEECLFSANEKFIRRFSYVGQKVLESGKQFEDFTLEELDSFWEEAKEKEKE